MSNKTSKKFGAIAVRGVVTANLDGKFDYQVWHDSQTLVDLGGPGGLGRKTCIVGERTVGSADSAALAKELVELAIGRLGAKINKVYEGHEMACAADAARWRLANNLWPDEATS